MLSGDNKGSDSDDSEIESDNDMIAGNNHLASNSGDSHGAEEMEIRGASVDSDNSEDYDDTEDSDDAEDSEAQESSDVETLSYFEEESTETLFNLFGLDPEGESQSYQISKSFQSFLFLFL